MKVINIHRRIINQPKDKVAELLGTLATENDGIWPYEQWPAMRFRDGLVEGARGGHGPIQYSIEKYIPHKLIQFRFIKPAGFNGIHKFEIMEGEKGKTELRHTIDMDVSGADLFLWSLAIRPLHNALLEDALDKAENRFLTERRKTEWPVWVKILRKMLK